MASKQGYGPDLRKYLDKRLDIRLNGNRHVAGKMKGYDQYMNITLDNAIEIKSTEEKRELGMIMIRGCGIQLWECLDQV